MPILRSGNQVIIKEDVTTAKPEQPIKKDRRRSAVMITPTATLGPVRERIAKSMKGKGIRKNSSQNAKDDNASSGRTLRSRKVNNTVTVALQNTAISERKKEKVAEFVLNEIDAARTRGLVFIYGGTRSTPFKPKSPGLTVGYSPDFFSNPTKWKVNYSPFLNWIGPQNSEIWDLFNALKAFYRNATNKIVLNATKNPLLPAHAYHGKGHLFHSLIEPILSAATSNNNQKLASASLFRRLTYRDDQISTESPNYHKLAKMSKQDLAEIISQSGRNKNNAEAIFSLFNSIKEENIRRMNLGAAEAEKIEHDAINANSWTPGLLSLDFMVGLNMQEMFDKLVQYRGIGCKTAACIMCFTFGFAVFAVDTHVFRLCQWLHYVPRGCSRDDAFKFLTIIVPPELMRDLHQALWHHGQLCFRCSEKTWNKDDDPRWKETVCPLEQFGIDRFPDWELKKKKKDDSDAGNNTDVQPKSAKARRDPDAKTTVWLKTDQDVADAKAAGHEIFRNVVDDSFGAAPELSNIREELKVSLHITIAQSKAFREFQREKRLEESGKKDNAKNVERVTKSKVVRKRALRVKETKEVTTVTKSTTITEIMNES